MAFLGSSSSNRSGERMIIHGCFAICSPKLLSCQLDFSWQYRITELKRGPTGPLSGTTDFDKSNSQGAFERQTRAACPVIAGCRMWDAGVAVGNLLFARESDANMTVFESALHAN
jgi:hypothetical protein